MSREPRKHPVFLPMPGKIVVRLHEESRIGTLFLPASAQQSRVMGTILAIGGDQTEGDDYDLTVGDTILFSQVSGIRVEVDRREVVVMRTSEVLCKLEWLEETEDVLEMPR